MVVGVEDLERVVVVDLNPSFVSQFQERTELHWQVHFCLFLFMMYKANLPFYPALFQSLGVLRPNRDT